ncbi:HAD family hydrolase [Streptomonospora wellingtoniae]|uniref:HAD family hydrolase n=1 Tax=Streptomonospora wellingtoniae TaxID=3075544 RepID=A0ABU2L112_9ACTN|nr:hypothetical protein [Streptomonospora sp. DSM 45055]MDT0305244.1 hypothetical protein [Streptomonospora sp. DSM 45055]
MFGAIIARGLDYRETFQVFHPGFDLAEQRQKRAEAGQPETFGEADLYSDVQPSLAKLREQGLWVGIAGNQTVRAGGILRSLDLPNDMIATSDDWGVSKPDEGFFRVPGAGSAVCGRRDSVCGRPHSGVLRPPLCARPRAAHART